MTMKQTAEQILQTRVEVAVGNALHDLGERMRAAGHFFASIPIYAEAERRLARVYGPGSFEATFASYRLALTYRETGALDQALAKFQFLRLAMEATGNTPQEFFDYTDECIADLRLRIQARRSMLAMLRSLMPAAGWTPCAHRARKGWPC